MFLVWILEGLSRKNLLFCRKTCVLLRNLNRETLRTADKRPCPVSTCHISPHSNIEFHTHKIVFVIHQPCLTHPHLAVQSIKIITLPINNRNLNCNLLNHLQIIWACFSWVWKLFTWILKLWPLQMSSSFRTLASFSTRWDIKKYCFSVVEKFSQQWEVTEKRSLEKVTRGGKVSERGMTSNTGVPKECKRNRGNKFLILKCLNHFICY